VTPLEYELTVLVEVESVTIGCEKAKLQCINAKTIKINFIFIHISMSIDF